jgi:hypothetical protein
MPRRFNNLRSRLRALREPALRVAAAALMFAAGTSLARADTDAATGTAAALPARLSETGLFASGSSTVVNPALIAFSPQYPLWSDGATKRRWMYLPPGTTIDASRPEAWEFPNGTRLWKEFSQGRRVETRYIERLADGAWRYATYIWNAEETDAELAPVDGIAAMPLHGSSDRRYAIPAEADCRACHEGAAVPVLGVSALQLSPDRDPLAPHAEMKGADLVDLRYLVERGLVRNLPASLLDRAPRIAASNPTERAALGYLHGNCGHCHNASGPLASLELVLAQDPVATATDAATTLRSLVGRKSRFRPYGIQGEAQRVTPGKHENSVLAMRMRSRNPMTQMPPLGTQVVDTDGLAIVQRWINDLPSQELTP